MILQVLKLIRVKHWIKNFFIFVPLIFSLNFFKIEHIIKCVATFFAFSFAASLTYILNDIIDVQKDRKHPIRKNRPIASGKISVLVAIIIGMILIAVSAFVSALVNIYTLIVILSYVIIITLYSLYLKHKVIIDVMIIALGFVLRIIAGATAISVGVSNWMLLTALYISLFMGFGKRRNAMHVLNDNAHHRPVLEHYSVKLLDYMMIICLTLTIITYSLYVVDPENVARLGTDKLIYTVPLVIYGVFRYLYNLYKKKESGDPADIVLKDASIIIVVLLWGIMVLLMLYFGDFKFL